MIERFREPVVSQEIDEIVYTSSKVACTKWLQLQARAVKVVGEDGLRAIVLSSVGGHKPSPLVYLHAMSEIATNLGDDPGLPRDLCVNLKANRLRPAGEGAVSPVFDEHFKGELPHLIEVLRFVLGHNLLGFTLGSHWLDGIRTSDATATSAPSSSPTPNEESSLPTSLR